MKEERKLLKKKKQKKWISKRHSFLVALTRPFIHLFLILVYHIDIKKYREFKNRQCIVLFNHQTGIDQFLPCISMRRHFYFVATEDIFSNGFVSKLLRWSVNPIPIRKQTTDLQAVKNMFQVLKEGGSIAIAPEGNRTYSGRTAYIKPSIVSLVKKFRLPIVIFRIEGGYGVSPRWGDTVRKGKMRAFVYETLEPEEYEKLSDSGLYERISKGLFADEGVADSEYISRKSAESLEKMIYVCPDCGLAKHESRGNTITCKKCGRETRYLKTKELEGVTEPFPFRFVTEWYDYQNLFVNSLDTTKNTEVPLFTDFANVFLVKLYDSKKLIFVRAKIGLYGDRITIERNEEDKEFSKREKLNGIEKTEIIELHYDKVGAVTVLGKNKLNIYTQGSVYQLKGDRHFNALKYVNLHERSMNIMKGHPEETFLGM